MKFKQSQSNWSPANPWPGNTRKSATKTRFGSNSLKIVPLFLFATALVGMGGATYSSVIEPSWVDTTEVPLTLPRLSKEFDGYRLVQISDIHMDGWMNRARLEDIVSRVNALNPDLIAITGDFVTHRPWKYAPDLIASLGRLSPKDGVVAIQGNHDHWSGSDVVSRVLRESGIQELKNCFLTLRSGSGQLHVAGVDDYIVREARLDRVLAQLPSQGAAILLAHEPDFADISARSGRFDLQISGHSHGGQVVLPIIGPPLLPMYCRKYVSGLYKVKDMLQYTNRGLGMVHFKVRFNCRPEITVFTLRSLAS